MTEYQLSSLMDYGTDALPAGLPVPANRDEAIQYRDQFAGWAAESRGALYDPSYDYDVHDSYRRLPDSASIMRPAVFMEPSPVAPALQALGRHYRQIVYHYHRAVIAFTPRQETYLSPWVSTPERVAADSLPRSAPSIFADQWIGYTGGEPWLELGLTMKSSASVS